MRTKHNQANKKEVETGGKEGNKQNMRTQERIDADNEKKENKEIGDTGLEMD